jgi:hypothetical protein
MASPLRWYVGLKVYLALHLDNSHASPIYLLPAQQATHLLLGLQQQWLVMVVVGHLLLLLLLLLLVVVVVVTLVQQVHLAQPALQCAPP